MASKKLPSLNDLLHTCAQTQDYLKPKNPEEDPKLNPEALVGFQNTLIPARCHPHWKQYHPNSDPTLPQLQNQRMPTVQGQACQVPSQSRIPAGTNTAAPPNFSPGHPANTPPQSQQVRKSTRLETQARSPSAIPTRTSKTVPPVDSASHPTSTPPQNHQTRSDLRPESRAPQYQQVPEVQGQAHQVPSELAIPAGTSKTVPPADSTEHLTSALKESAAGLEKLQIPQSPPNPMADVPPTQEQDAKHDSNAQTNDAEPQATKSAPELPELEISGQGWLGNGEVVPATPNRKDDTSKTPGEVANDYADLHDAHQKLQREYAELKKRNDDCYADLAARDEKIGHLNNDVSTAQRKHQEAERSYRALERTLKMSEDQNENDATTLNDERLSHQATQKKLEETAKETQNLRKSLDAAGTEYNKAQAEADELRRQLQKQKALTASAHAELDEKDIELNEKEIELNETRASEEQAQSWLGEINKALEGTFQQLGQALSPEDLVARVRELQRQNLTSHDSGTDLHRDLSSTSLDSVRASSPILSKKRRGPFTRQVSLGDELNQANDDSDDESERGAAVEMHDKGTSTSWPEDALALQESEATHKKLAEAEQESEEKGQRIKALEKELAARPANGDPIGTVAAPVAETTEKTWWEALLLAPWWAKLMALLLFLLWATSTFGAIHERQQWVRANVTPEMVRFYASPPTLHGLLSHAAGVRGSGMSMLG